MRVALARVTGWLRWRDDRRAARLLMAFARAERSSFYDMIAAARLSPDPQRRAAYLRHASDEARHALMLTLRAEQLDRTIASHPREQRADFEHLFEALGELRFAAFVCRGERRGRRQLSLFRDELAMRGDEKSRAMFDAILVDEAEHERYTREIVTQLSGGRADQELRRAGRWELWRSWLRAGRALSGAIFAWSMRVVYVLMFPLALIEKRRR